MNRMVFLALAAALASPAAPASAQPSFDGAWTVSATTSGGTGTCPRTYTLDVKIRGGAVSGEIEAGGARRPVTGRVGGDGTFEARAPGEDNAVFRGTLTGAAGTGTWSNGRCNGMFVMNRN